jgi:excisionase family DNA binding protein
METQDWLTVKEAAERLSVTERTITKHINEGKLEAKKEGREWRIHPDLCPSKEEWQNSEDGTPNSTASETGVEDIKTQILKNSLEMLQGTVGVLQNSLGTLEEQLLQKDGQIDKLQMLLAMEKQEKKALTEENKLLINDSANRQLPWWRKVFGRPRAQTAKDL